MAFEVVMPRLGWTMEVGTLLEWRKKDGDAVEVGDILFAVESDKAIQEVEALEAGVLRIPPDAPQPGQQVPVGTLLAYILRVGEPMLGATERHGEGPSRDEAVALPGTPLQPPPTAASAEGGPGATGRPAISPRARRLARELGIEWQSLRGTGRSGRIVERDVRRAAAKAAAAPGTPRATPVARRAAEALSVDLGRLAAATDGRRITRADVEAAASVRDATVTAPQEGVPISHMRRVIAERMAASARTTAAVTLTTEADATELVRLREQLKA
ncbi:MAG: E3 binding domain-containing protein, partial [Anaerolineae bacterium]|nr:E3 binding domain-containing protein [Anaerolineae bacterium]